MTDFGYSSDYEVYLTKENGVQIVTNDLSLAILKEMRYHEISPTNIALEFNVSKSTVQSSITKLLRMGIVSQDENVTDSRSVVYHIDAALLFTSDTDIKWQVYARRASAKRIMKTGRCTSREDLSLYGVSLTESGLNIVQGLFAVGSALVRNYDGLDYWPVIVDKIHRECEKRGIDVDVTVKDGLDLHFSSKDEDISDVPLIVVPMLGAIISKSKKIFGYHLVNDVQLSVENEGREVFMHVDPFIGQDYKRGDFHLTTLEQYRVNEPFAIYSLNGRATLFTNPTMMSVLYALSDGDNSANGLSDIIGIPKATVYAAIMKLIEMNAVEVDKSSSSPKNYKLIADPILYCRTPDIEDCSNIEHIVREFSNGDLDYYSAAISYAMESIRCMGIHFDKMFTRAGKSMAQVALELHPNIEPQQFLETACSMVSTPDNLEIMTLIPLKLRITLAQNTLWESWPGDFAKGYVAQGLKQLTGDEYKIRIETIRQHS
ncbi:ArsR family transcriptional regulator [methanogenic archaeon mixed culture ISO4-G1]|nr:ArsR family transcriptional regulator [methanogenic archaeon mixed culture ISO4-G1]